jgi:outer membrane protein
MLKRFIIAALLLLPTICFAQSVKIGIVDSQAIFTAHPDSKSAETKLGEMSKKYEEEFSKLREEYNRKVEEFQKLPQDELATIKERKAQDISALEVRINQFREQAQQDLQKEQANLLQPLQQKIMEAIESVGKEGSFTIIQEKDLVLYYSAPAIDITPLVKAKLGI